MEREEFGKLFEAYMAGKREEMRGKYDRIVPSGDLIYNRFDKGREMGCGEGSSVYDACLVLGDVEIGEHVWVGPFTVLDGSGGKVKIGDWVSVAAGTSIYTHDSTKNYLSGGKNPFEQGAVTIGDHCVIGTMCMIGCGVTVGDHCVIAAHSFVNKDIPAYSIAAGIPAKVIGRVAVREDGQVAFEYDSAKDEGKTGKEA